MAGLQNLQKKTKENNPENNKMHFILYHNMECLQCNQSLPKPTFAENKIHRLHKHQDNVKETKIL